MYSVPWACRKFKAQNRSRSGRSICAKLRWLLDLGGAVGQLLPVSSVATGAVCHHTLQACGSPFGISGGGWIRELLGNGLDCLRHGYGIVRVGFREVAFHVLEDLLQRRGVGRHVRERFGFNFLPQFTHGLLSVLHPSLKLLIVGRGGGGEGDGQAQKCNCCSFLHCWLSLKRLNVTRNASQVSARQSAISFSWMAPAFTRRQSGSVPSTVVAPAPEQRPPSSTMSTRPSIVPNTSMPDRQVGCPEILALVEIKG